MPATSQPYTPRLMPFLRRVRSTVAFGPHWGPLLAAHRVPLSAASLSPRTRSLRVQPLNGELKANRDEWLLSGYHHVLELRERCEASFAMGPGGELRVTTAAFQVDVTTAEELFMLREILCDTIYYFQAACSPWVLDIGLNTGMSALYFATVLGCSVVAYEPVPNTFERARHNLSLNPQAAARIATINRGIAASTRRERMTFTPTARGQASIYARESNRLGGEVVEVEVEAILDVLASVQALAGDAEIFAKVDCEGCEYEILDRLMETEAIRSIRHLMVEWHRLREDHDPVELASRLSKAGYLVSARGGLEGSFGMMYATQMGDGGAKRAAHRRGTE